MRGLALLLGCAVLILCHLKEAEAVACTSPGVPDDCVDCSDEANKDDPDCTTPTKATTTTTLAITTTTTAAPTTIVDAPPNKKKKPRRKRVRLTNVKYRNTRRVRVKRQGRPAAARLKSNRPVVRVVAG